MGLSADIKKAFFRAMDEDVLDSAQKSSLDRMSKDLANAIIDFLTEQTFTITEMKALLEIEELKTSTNLQADVLGNRLTTNVTNISGAPSAGGGIIPGTGTGTGRSISSPKAVSIPALELRKFGGQGGSMQSKGHAYIGNNPVDSAETNENNTKVKLLKRNIKGR